MNKKGMLPVFFIPHPFDTGMLISDFDYELPEELIAQQPLERRDEARMLVVNRRESSWRDSSFSELPALVRAGDALVVNNTRVFPARLVGSREPSGGRVELLLVRRIAGGEPQHLWEVLARPARRLGAGARASFGDGRLRAEVLDAGEGGRRVVRFAAEGDFDALLEEFGRMPLPPYIRRDADAPTSAEDRRRYQTVYAAESGAIAAPTAGLHFTPRVLTALREGGVHIAEVTLHVGYGTFEPVRAVELSEHRVAPESFEITEAAAAVVNDARREGRRIIAVGTTTVRALESAADETGRLRAACGETALTITPGRPFRAVDALLTNFHLPRSSLLLLVAAFAGRELVLAAYAHAVAARYRFYSYGDCMLIV